MRLDLTLPDKAVETGIQEVWELMSGGRFKVFASCSQWWQEYRLYHARGQDRQVQRSPDGRDATPSTPVSKAKTQEGKSAPRRGHAHRFRRELDGMTRRGAGAALGDGVIFLGGRSSIARRRRRRPGACVPSVTTTASARHLTDQG
jgi:hypothetical protein